MGFERLLVEDLILGLFRFSIIACFAVNTFPARADTALIAVAANFSDAATQIEAVFEAASPHQIELTTGSTGKLYAQITQGAPFDALLSADQKTPQRLSDENLAIASSRFTFGIGKIALYSRDPNLLDGQDGAKILADGTFRHLAIANPELAPYGAASETFLNALFLSDRVKDRLVTAENIGQTFSLVQTGAAELGFVAYSQVLKEGKNGSFWLVPQSLYPFIKQDAVILAHGKDNAAAHAFLAFLKTGTALAIMKSHGYDQH